MEPFPTIAIPNYDFFRFTFMMMIAFSANKLHSSMRTITLIPPLYSEVL